MGKKKKATVKFTRDELVEHNKEVLRYVLRHIDRQITGLKTAVTMMGQGIEENTPILDKFAEDSARYLFDT